MSRIRSILNDSDSQCSLEHLSNFLPSGSMSWNRKCRFIDYSVITGYNQWVYAGKDLLIRKLETFDAPSHRKYLRKELQPWRQPDATLSAPNYWVLNSKFMRKLPVMQNYRATAHAKHMPQQSCCERSNALLPAFSFRQLGLVRRNSDESSRSEDTGSQVTPPADPRLRLPFIFICFT